MEQARSTPPTGFSLVESIVALLIVAVLACLAVPAFGKMLARERLVAAQTELAAILQHARAVAVAQRHAMLLCPSRDAQRCADDTHWEAGWAFGPYRTGNADQLDGLPTRVHDAYKGLTIITTSGRKRLRFQPGGSTGGSNVTFVLCRQGDATDALSVTISNVGRVASARAAADVGARCAAGG